MRASTFSPARLVRDRTRWGFCCRNEGVLQLVGSIRSVPDRWCLAQPRTAVRRRGAPPRPLAAGRPACASDHQGPERPRGRTAGRQATRSERGFGLVDAGGHSAPICGYAVTDVLWVFGEER